MHPTIILNAFSLSMLSAEDGEVTIVATPISQAEAAWEVKNLPIAGIESAVGHESTANLFSKLLDDLVTANRVSVRLRKRQVALVGQYTGPRLPEGATELPDGATVQWWRVTVR